MDRYFEVKFLDEVFLGEVKTVLKGSWQKGVGVVYQKFNGNYVHSS